MKKLFYLMAAFATFAFTACSSDDGPQEPPVEEAYINASASGTWNYFSFSSNALVGTGAENATDNASWAARKDWDIAINRYNIRTNSGTSTAVSARGGVYTTPSSATFETLTSVPSSAAFAQDYLVTSTGMSGTTTVSQSDATVIQFKKNEDGSLVMPPVYLQSPVYVFRTADGAKEYKVLFTQYQNEEGTSGHVKFKHALLQ